LLQIAAEIPIQTKVQTFRLEVANEVLLALKGARLTGQEHWLWAASGDGYSAQSHALVVEQRIVGQ
jgi:hypothetical protein